MRFEDISTEQELIDYLDKCDDRLNGRKYIYHYTTIKRCLDIFQSKMWFLSGANCMNDQYEYRNGDSEIWNNLFFASFMSDTDESIGMWSMYSQPWTKGVQIAIPIEKAKKWIKSIDRIKEISCATSNVTGNEIECNEHCHVFLSAVAYTNCDSCSEQPQITWSNVSNKKLHNVLHNRMLTGYIKSDAWDYEKEIRIKAVFDNAKNYKRVAIDVPDYVLDSIKIKAGPFFDEDLDIILKTKIQRNLLTEKSLFTGRLQLTKQCEHCEIRTE